VSLKKPVLFVLISHTPLTPPPPHHRTGQALAPTSPLWATRGKLWTGQPGLSRSRWDFWKTRFEAAAGEPGNTSAETRKIARLAERAMGLVEVGGEGL